MAPSRYPRYGYRIAPVTLADVLDVPAPPEAFGHGRPIAPVRLSDLDSGAWERFGADACEALAEAIVRRVKLVVPLLRGRHLPRVANGATLDDLDLSVRTDNCLRIHRRLTDPASLADLTIGDVLRTKNFGIRSLLDLLTSLESFGAAPEAPPDARLDEGLTRVAQELQELPVAAHIRRDDPRLGYLVMSIEAGAATAQAAAASLLARTADPSASSAIAERIGRLREQALEMSTRTLEGELLELVTWTLRGRPSRNYERAQTEFSPAVRASTARNARMVLRYLGWDGAGGTTLQNVGEEFHVSRERVRQVCDECSGRLAGRRPYAPVLDGALKFLTERAPAVADQIEAALAEEGIAALPFKLEGLLSAAEMLGRHSALTLASSGGSRILVETGKEGLADSVIRVARRALSRWGVATISDVAAQVSEDVSYDAPVDFVARLITSRRDFQWLDQEAGWFWFQLLRRNRLLTVIRKVLAVARRIRAVELRAGISRVYDFRGFAPPRRVLLTVCRQIPAYRVDGEFVTADPQWNADGFLSETEQMLVEVLRESGGVRSRLQLEEAWLARGLRRDTLYAYLTYSPVIARLAPEVYSLRGADIQPGVVESLVPRKQGSRRFLLDYGWTDDRKLWIGYKLSRSMLLNGVLGIPAAIKQFLNGEYALRAADGSLVGTFVVRENQAWGLGPFYTRRGGEEGDHLLVVIDLRAREARVSLGDASLIEGLQSIQPPARG